MADRGSEEVSGDGKGEFSETGESRFVISDSSEFRVLPTEPVEDSEPVEESAEDKSDLADAALAAITDALLSGVGPDGRPSRKARQRAKRILDTMQDESAVMKAIEREVGDADAE